VYSVID